MKKRIQIDISEKAMNTLKKHKNISGDSYTSVIMKALSLYDTVLDNMGQDESSITFKNKDGNETHLVIL